MEIRLKDIKLDYNSEQRKLGGYINVVERASETLYSKQRGKWFKETIKAGTFTRALQKNDSIPMLLEHDWDRQIAHTANGTLELREDAIGLRFDAIVDEDTFNEIQRRNITSCSFGMKVNEQEFESINPKMEKRYISNIDLFEVSLVANPAYVGSLVEQRNMERALEDMKNEVKAQEEVVVDTTNEEQVAEVRAEETTVEPSETECTVEENTVIEETTNEVVQEEEVSSTDSTEVEVEETEERTVDIDTTSSDIKADAKEVIDTVIEQTQADAEFYGELAKGVDEYKEEVKEEMENTLDALENESLYYTTLAYTKWLEVAKLKQISMNL